MGSRPEAFLDKIYYKIGEVSRITGVKSHVLRYWESEFKEIKPLKSRSLQRLYQKKDIELIFKIKQLLYKEGYTIAGARTKIKELAQGNRKPTQLDFDKQRMGEIILDLKAKLKGIRQILE